MSRYKTKDHRVILGRCDRCAHLVCFTCEGDIARWGRGYRHLAARRICWPFKPLALSA